MNNQQILTREEELSRINSYSRKTLTWDDVYVFTVTLCDNEIDRDFERFSKESLKELEKLFVGKTGISDHSMRSKDQTARLFYCYTETDSSKKTSFGEAYTALKGRAYMLKTKANEALIEDIDGGIKKEVSVGCSVKQCICSVCGKDMKNFSCEHSKGKYYNGKLCFGTLQGVSDAYEWSFVAVPAQRNAGVTKAFKNQKREEKTMSFDIQKALSENDTISHDTAQQILNYVNELEALAEVGRKYKGHLLSEIERCSLVIMPEVNAKHFIKGCSAMEIDELKSLKESLGKKMSEMLPCAPQTAPYVSVSANKNYNAFMI